MLTLEMTSDELKAVEYNEEAIKNILVSRAIYNESYNYEFNEKEAEEIKYLEKNEIIRLYMHKTVEPRVIVTENSIIDRYNKDKAYFDNQNIPFTKAHEIIKSQLNAEVNYGLEQDLVTNLVHNMADTVTLKKEDIIFSKGDPELIKTMVLFELLTIEANKIDFFNKYAKDIDILKKEVRIKYYVNHICSKDIKITEEQVSKFYVDHTNDFSGVDIQVAYNNIASYLFQQEMDKRTNEYILSISEKYHLDEEVKKYKKDDKDVVNSVSYTHLTLPTTPYV